MRSALLLLLCLSLAIAPVSCTMAEALGDQADAHQRIAEADEGLAENARALEELEAENARMQAELAEATAPEEAEQLREQRANLERSLRKLSQERKDLYIERGRAEGRAQALEEYIEGEGRLISGAAGAAGGPAAAGLAQGLVGLLGLGAVVLGRARAMAS